MEAVKKEMQLCLADKIIPFWLGRSVDDQYGGYLTNFEMPAAFGSLTETVRSQIPQSLFYEYGR